jgi:hypothetical protein
MNITSELPTWQEFLQGMLATLQDATYYALTHSWTIALLVALLLLTIASFVKDYGHFVEYDDPAPWVETDEAYGERIAQRKHH